MPDPRFVGLVHSVLSSAQAAAGERHSPMGRHLDNAGVRSRRTAERSLALLSMLAEKTRGNLDETERSALNGAIRDLRDALDALDAPDPAGEPDDDARTALPLADAGPTDR